MQFAFVSGLEVVLGVKCLALSLHSSHFVVGQSAELQQLQQLPEPNSCLFCCALPLVIYAGDVQLQDDLQL